MVLKKSESNSVFAKTACTANASKMQELFANKPDFLSSQSSLVSTNKKIQHNTASEKTTAKKIYYKNTAELALSNKESETVEAEEQYIDCNSSVVYEEEYTTKTYDLQYICKQKKLRNRVLDFLAPADMVALRSVNKFIHFTLSVESRVFNSILQHHHSQFEVKIASLEKKLSLFEGNTANISGDYVQFLLYKYVKLKKSPGQYIQDAFCDGNQLFNMINDKSAVKTLNQKQKEVQPPTQGVAFMEKLDDKIKSSSYAEKWSNFKSKFGPKNTTAVAEVKHSQTVQKSEANVKDANATKSVNFVEKPAVQEEIERLKERALNQDLEAIGIKLETDINSVPKELIIERNNYFDKTMSQIKEGIETFNKMSKDLSADALRDLSTTLFSNWIRTFFMSQLLFQEAKELGTLKEFLACELAKTCFENCGLTSQVENLKEELGVTQRVKEYLLSKSRNLELKIHETTCENASFNEQRRIMEIQTRSLEESLNKSQNYSKVLEQKVTQLYGDYQSVQKSEKMMRKENGIIVSDAQKIMSVFDELDI